MEVGGTVWQCSVQVRDDGGFGSTYTDGDSKTLSDSGSILSLKQHVLLIDWM